MPTYGQFGDVPKTEVSVSWHSTTHNTPADLPYGTTAELGQTATSTVSKTVTGYVHHVKLP